ncbi:ABC transporter ATP-binding protein [Christensenellaceae bacterium OttesenSCG-928-M15]|nr:ABC transporter ATP-binding protein [Christensenellaceae bacterium OttesenSCG-928-M15]
MNSLAVRNLTKRYGQKEALRDMSFTLAPHRIYGLLGRNGAGKTTLLSILSNRQFPTSGEIVFDDMPMLENDAVQRKIYSMSETMLYTDTLRVKEIIRLSAHFYENFDYTRCQELLRAFRLEPKLKVKTLSTGYASILKLIIALSTNAELLLLDEPVLGLDANHRELFYTALLDLYAKSETTIVLSTHLIEEVSNIVEDVLIVDEGTLRLSGNVEELKQTACTISGEAALVDAFIKGEEVLGEKRLGSEKAVYLLAQLDAVPEGLKLSRMGLQQLFVQLTNSVAEGDYNVY